MTYSEKLLDPRWQKRRLQILHRDNWTCCYCGDTQTNLQVHHKSYSGDPWEANDEILETVCSHCHEVLEFLKKQYGQVSIGRIVKAQNVDYTIFISAYIVGEIDRTKFAVALFEYLIPQKKLYFFTTIRASIVVKMNSGLQDLKERNTSPNNPTIH